MTIAYRFALTITSICAILTFSACQPSTDSVEDTEGSQTQEVLPPPVAPPKVEADKEDYIDNQISASDMVADGAVMSDVLKDYTKSMSKMHDEIAVGIGYNDPDTAFAKAMLGHHRGAIDMANIELKYGTDTKMLALAQRTIDTQQAELDIIKKWLASHPDVSKPKPETQAMQQAYAGEVEAMHDEVMLAIADPVPDMAFARGMLAHYIGAVDMAIIQLKYGKDKEMRTLAQQIIDAQQPEIETIQDWLAMHSTDELILDELEEMAEAN